MNYETEMSKELYRRTVADKEKLRQTVLERAHRESAGAEITPLPLGDKSRRAPRRLWLKIAAGPLAACAAFFLLLNVSMPFAKAVDQVPLLAGFARLITFRQWDYADDAVTIHGEQPAVENTGNAALEGELNPLIESKMQELDRKAQADAAEYKENWLNMGNNESDFVPLRYTFDYETYCSGENVLSFVIRQQRTITTDTADTDETLYYYNLNPATGEPLTLEGLVGSNWKELAAAAVDRQIQEKGDDMQKAYYQTFWLDAGVPWDDSQMFYVNAEGQVVLVFYEGVIAPFEYGIQTFLLNAEG